MNEAQQRKINELFDRIFYLLWREEDGAPSQDLAALRLFINDMQRFSSAKIFEAKFRQFIKKRDEHLRKNAPKEDVLTPTQSSQKLSNTETGGAPRQAINQALDQALKLLEGSLSTSSELDLEVQAAIGKIKQAKNLNSFRKASDMVIAVGNRMVDASRNFSQDISRLGTELSLTQQRVAELEGQLSEQKQAAQTDHLTGLFNRRSFDRDFEHAVARAKRFQSQLCLLLVDIDHFKQINDTWGHQVGDDVLINFAKLLQRSLREQDLTYRLGGDEFAVLFMAAPLENAARIAKRVADFVYQNPYKVKDIRFKVSISGGLAGLLPQDNHASLFKRADQLLYKAKQKGRNCICFEHEHA